MVLPVLPVVFDRSQSAVLIDGIPVLQLDPLNGAMTLAPPEELGASMEKIQVVVPNTPKVATSQDW